MPAIFVGHGNPMNTLGNNHWTEGWKNLGANMPRPKAILVVSAHWYLSATKLTAMPHPRTIHDFGGFPRELYGIRYPAPGSLPLAMRVKELLTPDDVELDEGWGLDHGTWSVLYHIFPKADIPIVQLSIDRTRPPSFHYEIGQLLMPLREEGVLILGSGNLVHNLHTYDWRHSDISPFNWAVKFEEEIRDFLLAGKDDRLINYEELGPEARISVPTPDHFLPLLYVLGSRREADKVSFPVEGFDGGSMSMLTVEISA